MDDLISRREAIDALNRHLDTIPVVNNNTMEMIRRSEVMDCREIINGLPSAEVRTYMSSANDTISRQAAKDALAKFVPYAICDESTASYTNGLTDAYNLICQLPSSQPERMTNRQWIDFLSAQFDISRTSAKEMLHGMMQWKKEDNFKKMFNGGKT